jgi:hypothetical protein
MVSVPSPKYHKHGIEKILLELSSSISEGSSSAVSFEARWQLQDLTTRNSDHQFWLAETVLRSLFI